VINDAHRGALDAIDRLVNRGLPREATFQAAADILRARFPGYERVDVRAGAENGDGVRIVRRRETLGTIVLEPATHEGDREFLERAARMLATVA
jgi:hypothetical protein